MTTTDSFRIRGTLHGGDATARVEAWERRATGDVLLATAAVAPDGSYRLALDPGLGRRPDVFLRVVRDDETLVSTAHRVAWSLRPGDTTLDVTVPADRRVEGQVRDADHRPAADVEVRVRRMGASGRGAVLGRARTGPDGRYVVSFDAEGPIDLEVDVAGGPRIARYGVGLHDTVNVALGDVPWPGPSTFERLDADAALLGPGRELGEDDADRVAARTGADPDAVRRLAIAQRLGVELGIAAEIAFALVSRGLPAEAEALAAAPPSARKGALDASLADNVIPRAARNDVEAALTTLRDRHVATLLDEHRAGAVATLGEALKAAGVLGRGRQEELLATVVDDEGASAPEDLGIDATAALALDLAALTDNNPPLIARVRGLRGVSALSDLAALDADAWVELIADADAPTPSRTAGRTEERRRASYGGALADRLEVAYPAEAILGRAARDEELPEHAGVAGFVRDHPGFRLDGPPVAAEVEVGRIGEVDPAVVARVASLQRMARLTPRYGEIRELRRDDLGSALAISQRGEAAFAARHARTFGDEEAARAVHRRAADVAGAALNLVATLAPQFQLDTAATSSPAPVPTLPDWETLFGSADFCSCEHCGSVVGPAAYLTEALHFLEQRPAQAGRSAKDVLFARRPDLGEVELTCQNTSTTLPYIDLVNEVLEGAIAPRTFALDPGLASDHLPGGVITPDLLDAFTAAGYRLTPEAMLREHTPGRQWSITDGGWRFSIIIDATAVTVSGTPQTSGTSREQDANPEHIHPPAYEPLRTEPYPWTLPYDAWLDEVRVYLGHLGVERASLMREFAAGNGVGPSLVAERLGLATGEAALLTGSVDPWRAWGAPSAASWTVPLRNVRALLDRAGLRFDELSELLTLRWVNPGGLLRFESSDPNDAHTCDTTKLTIADLTPEAADRIHRFTRLRRRLDWTAHEIDRALTLLPGGTLDEEGLDVLAGLNELHRDLGLPVAELLSWFAPLDTHGYPGADGTLAPSPYDRLFRNRSVVKPAPGQIDPFALIEDGTELAVVGFLATDPAEPEAVQRAVQETRSAIVGAFAISAADLALLIDSVDSVVSDTRLADLANLSRLWRHVVLARALRLSIADMLAVKRLIGLDPFVDAATAIGPTDIARARYFVDAVAELRASGASIAELDYVLAHRVDPRAPRGPAERTLTDALTGLRDTLQAIRDDTRPVPDPVGEVTERKLVAAGWSEEDASAARELLLGQTTFRRPLAALPAGVVLPAALPVRFIAGTLECTGPLTLAMRATLDGLSTDTGFRQAVADLFDAPRDQVAALLGALPTGEALLDTAAVAALFDTPRSPEQRLEPVLARLDAYLRRTGGAQAVAELLAGILDLTVPAVEIPLTRWPVDPSAPGARLLERFVDPAFVDSSGPVTATAFRELTRTLVLLYKIADIVRRYRLPAAQLEQLLVAVPQLGWLDPATLPLEAGDPPASVQPWLRMDQALRWQAALQSPEPTVLDLLVDAAAFDLAGVAPDEAKAALVEGWARVTGWDVAELEVLLGPRDDVADGGLLDVVLPAAAGDYNPWADEGTWLRVRRCFEAAERIGTNVTACHAWAGSTLGENDARNARRALKSHYDGDTWPQVVSPLSDALRERRRVALVARLLASPPPGSGVRDADDLYAWFLLDVEMSACMTTSRLRQAISSVQLFVQRCLLNLEPEVPLADPSWEQWRWMKTYRVWEAARKIFLWPENWVEPELRDDKSPAFRELEEALAQKDLDEENARDALLGYLERLEEVAQLDVVGLHEEIDTAPLPATRVVHVVARTRGTPARYFHRQRVDRGLWSGWEPLDLDVEGDAVVLRVWNGRLHLLWPGLSEVQEQGALTMPAEGESMSTPAKRQHVQLAWSEYKRGRWTPKRMTTDKVWVSGMGPLDREQLALIPFEDGPTGDLIVLVRQYGGTPPERTYQARFRLSAATGGGAVTDATGTPIDGTRQNVGWFSPGTPPLVPPGVRISHMAHRETAPAPFVAHDDGSKQVTVLGDTPGTIPFRVRGEDFPRLRIVLPMVFSDGSRSLFLEPRRVLVPSGVSSTGATVWTFVSRLRAFAFHHPKVRSFALALRRGGLRDLYARGMQTAPAADLGATYQPGAILDPPFPTDDVDFAYDGAYSLYNWELFFHVPLLIADRLSRNQRFEEAQRWLHFVFDPTDRSGEPAPRRYWRLRPFFETTDAQRAAERVPATLPDPQLSDQVRRWRNDPFDPHTVARMRHTAYQRATVMKYLDNLIAWGDQLFRRDTIESINEATQLYVLAADILGRRPEEIPTRARPVAQTYNTIAPQLDILSNALVAAESLVPPLEDPALPSGTPPVTLPAMRYFCIPRNERLLGYWKLVGERLFNIRHCRNIEGVERQLALFEPEIEPGALVRAAAAGVDIGQAISDASAPLPPYRFSALAQKATELCTEVKAFGAALLAALEKRDAEALALLRSTHEIELLGAVRRVRELQVDEAERNITALDSGRELVTLRRDYYANQPFTNVGETMHLAMAGAALVLQGVASGMEGIAGALSLVPDVKVGVPTSMGATFGGSNLVQSLRAFSSMVGSASGLMQTQAGLALTLGGYERRAEEWRHQTRLAEKELEQLERQRAAAELRAQIAQRELANHDLQAANAADARSLMEDKYTNRQLYDWMVGQVSGLYFRSYQLAYDVAKRAERAYRYELGLQDSNFIRFGSWDSLRKGLLAGDRLAHELKRMEVSWLDENRRYHELTRTVSLAMLDPAALLALRATGSCFVTLPEGLFDLDHPGHYLRRLKSVSVTIPAVAGAYTNVNATLTLLHSRVRVSAAADSPHTWTGPDDPRFAEVTTTVQSIATSHGQRDAGVFQLDFRDERYLPFEGQGAFSEWRLELDPEANRFDLGTVSDVLLHVSYTARDGGSALKRAAKGALARAEVRLLSARHELASEWHHLLNAPDGALFDELRVDVGQLMPYRPEQKPSRVARVDVYARVRADGAGSIPDLPLELRTGTGAAAPDVLAGTPLRPVPALGGLSAASAILSTPASPGEWLLRIAGSAVPSSLRRSVTVNGSTRYHLATDALSDLYLAVHFVP
jgi:Tc toxin complex TcA C-terminal TcB-binding domain/Neuraminidase-like domain/Salmonella virulence plasmid 28.1kDa A protein